MTVGGRAVEPTDPGQGRDSLRPVVAADTAVQRDRRGAMASGEVIADRLAGNHQDLLGPRRADR